MMPAYSFSAVLDRKDLFVPEGNIGGSNLRRQDRGSFLRIAVFGACAGLIGALFSGFFPHIFGNRTIVVVLAFLIFVCGLASVFVAVWRAGHR